MKTPIHRESRELLYRHLPGILSIEQGDLPALLKQHREEAGQIARLFELVSDQMESHKWSDAVLAKVPLDSWTRGPGNTVHISPVRAGSMRYLSREKEPMDKALELVQARRTLLEGLLDRMPPPLRLQYRSMMEWRDAVHFGSVDIARYKLSSDSAFGYNLVFLEHLLSQQIFIYDQNWRKEERIPIDEATPCAVTHASSQMALDHLSSIIQGWVAEQGSLSAVVPESMLARVSANLSVNRALLERAAMDELGAEAAEMSVPFLTELNRQGITAVPEAIVECSPDEVLHRVREQLKAWFAHGGSLTSSDGFFQRRMTTSDIDAIVQWSLDLQELYMSSRGAQGGPESAKESHGNPGNFFIFALAMAASFYCKARAPYELTGKNNSTYAVFPPRGRRGDELPTHASQMLMQCYGQMFFPNTGWNIHAERVNAYAETTRIKRAHVQQLLSFAVKHRSSRELLAVHTRLQYYHEKAMKDAQAQSEHGGRL